MPKPTAWYAEIFFDPQTHTARGIDLEVFVEGIVQALHDGEGRAWHHMAAYPELPAPPDGAGMPSTP